MALQTTDAISLGNIQGEHGGSNPISISEYYDGDMGVMLYYSNPQSTTEIQGVYNAFKSRYGLT